jgi:16S rRNA (guanine527-N7)-methyltransferase
VEALRQPLEAGLLSLGLSFGGAEVDRLLQFLHLLDKWGSTYNLTAIRDPRAAVDLHLLDSVLVLPHLEGASRILDVGTGAGLPGIPLAILMPASRFVLIDRSAKKIRFVRQAILELGLTNVEAVATRIEMFRPQGGAFDAILARAFASLLEIRGMTSRLLAPDGRIAALKGRFPEDELAELGAVDAEVRPLVLPGVAVDRHLVLYR